MIQMKKNYLEPSKHVVEDNEERTLYILKTPALDITNIVLEHRMVEENKRECVTSSGVLLVKALERDFVITAYMATMDKIYALYRAEGHDHIPTHLAPRFSKNQIHVKLQNMTEAEREKFLRKNRKRG